jgi:hypothetical protein
MPYLKQDRRKMLFDLYFSKTKNFEIELTAGDLNYIFTKLIDSQLKSLNYAKINEMIGALECAKLELYRRVAAPYEDIKMEENGDVYE